MLYKICNRIVDGHDLIKITCNIKFEIFGSETFVLLAKKATKASLYKTQSVDHFKTETYFLDKTCRKTKTNPEIVKLLSKINML